MTNTESCARTLVVSVLAALFLFGLLLQPVAQQGVRLDLDNAGEDVLGCLVEMGYEIRPGGRFYSGSGHLVVTPADRARCAASV